MSDVLLDFCDCVDVSINDCADIAMADDLQNAVMISLFTDARASDSDVLPNQNDRRGYWGSAIDGENWGSKLWLLETARDLQTTYNDAKQYASDALAWLVTDGVAEKVEVETGRYESDDCKVLMALQVKIYKPRQVINFNFQYAWQLKQVVSCGKIVA